MKQPVSLASEIHNLVSVVKTNLLVKFKEITSILIFDIEKKIEPLRTQCWWVVNESNNCSIGLKVIDIWGFGIFAS